MTEMRLTLIPADGEGDLKDSARQMEYKALSDNLNRAGAKHYPMFLMQKSAEGGSWFNGEFLFKEIPMLASVSSVLIAYLAGKASRKVRMKIGNVELEANSVKELENMIELARKHK